MQFADATRKIAARAYADAISLPELANGTYGLDTSPQRFEELAALGHAADALLTMVPPEGAKARVHGRRT